MGGSVNPETQHVYPRIYQSPLIPIGSVLMDLLFILLHITLLVLLLPPCRKKKKTSICVYTVVLGIFRREGQYSALGVPLMLI